MEPFRHIGRRHIHLDVTDSTNNRAIEFAGEPAHAGTVVTADLQTGGRGQHGRVWESPPGLNVLLSVLLFPPPALRRPAVLTAFAAVAVAETVFQAIGRPTRIKWPNDVHLDGKKVCGILIEGGVSTVPYSVVGIGLNVNSSADDFVRMNLAGATSLSADAGISLDRQELTDRLIRNLDVEYGRLLDNALDSLQARWARGIGLVGHEVEAERLDTNTVRGQLTELSFRGLTLAQRDGLIRRLLPEEVRHLRPIGPEAA